MIARHAKGWDLDRIAPLERNVMRVALYEIEHSDDVPTEVAIDEAVEIAKEYCGADAPGFVNGILGAIGREEALMAGGPRDARLREISERLQAIAAELEGDVADDERAAGAGRARPPSSPARRSRRPTAASARPTPNPTS